MLQLECIEMNIQFLKLSNGNSSIDVNWTLYFKSKCLHRLQGRGFTKFLESKCGSVVVVQFPRAKHIRIVLSLYLRGGGGWDNSSPCGNVLYCEERHRRDSRREGAIRLLKNVIFHSHKKKKIIQARKRKKSIYELILYTRVCNTEEFITFVIVKPII